MTTQKPELMPDGINVCVDTMQIKDFENKYTTRYTRTDLYTAACAERDALRALCEGMQIAIEGLLSQYGNMSVSNPKKVSAYDAAMNTLTAYEKHKAGE